MPDRKSPSPLDELGARLTAARGRRTGARADDEEVRRRGSSLSVAYRLAVEMVAAVAVGTGIGWLLDEWAGTRPWLMVAFIVLGFAAGIMNVYRLMKGMGGTVGYKPAERRDEDES